MDLDDFFTFAVERIARLDALRDGAAVRYHVAAQLAGRRFDDVTVDVGFSSVMAPEPDIVPGTELLAFAGIDRLEIPTIALEQHVAEKVHAYTRSYESGGSTRVKDLVDLVLTEQFDTPRAGRLMKALKSTFETRGAHAVPAVLPPPPSDWLVAYRYLAADVGLPADGNNVLNDAHARAASFLQPVLDGTAPGDAVWDPGTRQWVSLITP
jgi:hypothetical protein